MANRSVYRIPRKVYENRNVRYPGFPDTDECWEQSEAHRTYFVSKLNCHEIKEYHLCERGCKPFDNFIGRWYSEPYRTKFFKYYEMINIPEDETYMKGLVKSKKLIRSYSGCRIIKKTTNKVKQIPPKWDDWPQTFDITMMTNSVREQRNILKSIETKINVQESVRFKM